MIVRTLFACLVVSALSQGAAFAQSSNTKESGNASNTTSTQNSQSLPQEIRQKLQNDGYTDVKVVPSSFLVQAKDKGGDPVMMMIGPHMTTMITQMSPNESSTTGNSSSKGQSNPSGSNSK